LLRHLAEVSNINVEELYEKIVWPLNDIFGYYGGAYDAFVIASQDPE